MIVNTATLKQHSRNSTLATWLGRQSIALGISVVILATTGYLKWQSQQMPENTQVPMPNAPSPNAYDFYAAAEEMLHDGHAVAWALDPSGMPASKNSDWNKGYHFFTIQDKKYLVRENAPALAKMREGIGYASLNPPIRSYDSPFRNDGKDRDMGRLLVLEGRNSEAREDWGAAANSYLDAIKFGSDVLRGVGIGSALSAISIQAAARRQMQSTIAHVNADQAQHAVHRLLQIDASRVTATEVLQNEQWQTQGSLLGEFRKPQWHRGFINSQDDTSKPALRIALQLESARTAYDNYSDYTNRVIAQSHLPWPELRQAKPPALPADPINQMLLPIFTEIAIRVFANTTFNRLLETQLALRAYKWDQGTYPDTLVALTPKYLPSVPTDPFSDNQPLRYRRKDVGYLLYSIGPDTKDDDGVPVTTKMGGKIDHFIADSDTPGDAVAGVND